MNGWLGLIQQRLSLCKKHQASLGAPTVMLSDGTKLHHSMALANIQDGKIISVGKLHCYGEGCYEATRGLFEKALNHESPKGI